MHQQVHMKFIESYKKILVTGILPKVRNRSPGWAKNPRTMLVMVLKKNAYYEKDVNREKLGG